MQKIKGSHLEFSVGWRKNILLLLLFGKRRRILFCNFGRPPQRSRQRKKASSFSSSSILGKKNFKNFPFILSKKRVGYKKKSETFPSKKKKKNMFLKFPLFEEQEEEKFSYSIFGKKKAKKIPL